MQLISQKQSNLKSHYERYLQIDFVGRFQHTLNHHLKKDIDDKIKYKLTAAMTSHRIIPPKMLTNIARTYSIQFVIVNLTVVFFLSVREDLQQGFSRHVAPNIMLFLKTLENETTIINKILEPL